METTKISTSTIVRTVCLFLAILNHILTISGHTVLPVSDEQVAEVISLVITIVTSVVAWWKNNSFTKEAIAADIAMHEAKAERHGGEA